MPKYTKGPQPKKRVKRLLEALLCFVGGEFEDGDFDIKHNNWIAEDGNKPELIVKTTLVDLERLTAKDKYPGKLKTTQIREALKLLDEKNDKSPLKILKDNRYTKKGSAKWHFTLKLWSKDKEENLKRFDEVWESNRSSKSKALEDSYQQDNSIATTIRPKTDISQAPSLTTYCSDPPEYSQDLKNPLLANLSADILSTPELFLQKKIQYKTIHLPVDKMFVHFLDHHFLQLHNRLPKTEIYWECKLGLKVAILASYEILIPAVSYVQSHICRSLVDEMRSLWQRGCIRLIADSSLWEEFIETRLTEYNSMDITYETYKKSMYNIKSPPPLLKVQQNTTVALHNHWKELLEAGQLEWLFSHELWKQALEKQAEQRSNNLLEYLDGRAFLAENICPLLYSKEAHYLMEQNLREFICKMLFTDFLVNLQCPIISPMLQLTKAVPNTTSAKLNLVKFRQNTSDELLKFVVKASGEELLKLRNEPKVDILLKTSFEYPLTN